MDGREWFRFSLGDTAQRRLFLGGFDGRDRILDPADPCLVAIGGKLLVGDLRVALDDQLPEIGQHDAGGGTIGFQSRHDILHAILAAPVALGRRKPNTGPDAFRVRMSQVS